VLVVRLATENPSWATAGSTANWPRWGSGSQRRVCGPSSIFLRSQPSTLLAWDFFTMDTVHLSLATRKSCRDRLDRSRGAEPTIEAR
jgi:hypothetical protein